MNMSRKPLSPDSKVINLHKRLMGPPLFLRIFSRSLTSHCTPLSERLEQAIVVGVDLPYRIIVEVSV